MITNLYRNVYKIIKAYVTVSLFVTTMNSFVSALNYSKKFYQRVDI